MTLGARTKSQGKTYPTHCTAIIIVGCSIESVGFRGLVESHGVNEVDCAIVHSDILIDSIEHEQIAKIEGDGAVARVICNSLRRASIPIIRRDRRQENAVMVGRTVVIVKAICKVLIFAIADTAIVTVANGRRVSIFATIKVASGVFEQA